MSHARFARRGRHIGLLATLGCTLTIVAAFLAPVAARDEQRKAPAVAQGVQQKAPAATQGAQKGAAASEAQSSAAQAKDAAGPVEPAAQSSAAQSPAGQSGDLKAIEQKLDAIQKTQAAPKEAWYALGFVGTVFVVAWAFVSWLREKTRINEAKTNERIAAINAETKANDAEVRERLEAVVDLLNATKAEVKKVE